MAKRKAAELPSSDKIKRLEDTVMDINKKAKGSVVIRGMEDLTSPWMYLRRPTGVTSLDIGLHGGVPAGGISRWWGERSAGKDLMFWNAVKMQQIIYEDNTAIAVGNTDTGLDKTQARMLGVVLPYSEDELFELQKAEGITYTPEIIAELSSRVGIFHEIIAENSEILLDTILQLVQLNMYSLICVNSLGSLASSKEIEMDTLEDSPQVGYDAMLKSRFVRLANHHLRRKDALGRHNTTHLWLIDQVRSKIGASKWEDPLKPTGAHQTDHLIMTDVKVEAGAKIKVADKTVGKMIRCIIRKQKSGGNEGESIEFPYHHPHSPVGAGIDFAGDLIDCAVRYSLIGKAGSYLEYEGTKIYKSDLTEKLKKDPELYTRMRQAVFKKAGIHVNYVE